VILKFIFLNLFLEFFGSFRVPAIDKIGICITLILDRKLITEVNE
jgi:hypothetical protein